MEVSPSRECDGGGLGDILRFLCRFLFAEKRLVKFFLSYEKTGWCHALKKFLTKRRGGVVPSCMLLTQHIQKTRVVLNIFPMKRRGGVVPSCVLSRHVQKTNIVLRLITVSLQNVLRL